MGKAWPLKKGAVLGGGCKDLLVFLLCSFYSPASACASSLVAHLRQVVCTGIQIATGWELNPIQTHFLNHQTPLHKSGG